MLQKICYAAILELADQQRPVLWLCGAVYSSSFWGKRAPQVHSTSVSSGTAWCADVVGVKPAFCVSLLMRNSFWSWLEYPDVFF